MGLQMHEGAEVHACHGIQFRAEDEAPVTW